MAAAWAGTGALPPPPGIEPNFIDPPSQVQGDVALHGVLLTLATLGIAMRFYTRQFITRSKWGLDDLFCFLSWGMSLGFSALMFKCFEYGIGRHMWDTPAIWLTDAFRWFTFASYLYILLSLAVRLTFLFFYYRVFSHQGTVKYVLIGAIIVFSALNLGVFFATLFNCNPREKAWDQTVPGKCINPEILPWISGGSSALGDVFVLLLPLPVLWGLNMDLKKKVRVLGVFGLGLFSCVASLVRLGMIPLLRSSFDATWNIASLSNWATLEVNIAILCACLMLLPAFLERHLPAAIRAPFSRFWDWTLSAISRKTDGGSLSWRIPGTASGASSRPSKKFGKPGNNNPSDSESTDKIHAWVEPKAANGLDLEGQRMESARRA
ncbi:putative integral membrane protein Pth11-like [Cladorrhinum sp. PSN332]|nr:putative integral membrane protein Pth11-like [Cladorrhinum sp. PSN332]